MNLKHPHTPATTSQNKCLGLVPTPTKHSKQAKGTIMWLIDKLMALPAYAYVLTAHWLDNRRKLKEMRRAKLRAGKERQ